MMLDTNKIKEMTKSEQHRYMGEIKERLPEGITMTKIAREADVSLGLVSAVFSGLNSNEKVLEIIKKHVENT